MKSWRWLYFLRIGKEGARLREVASERVLSVAQSKKDLSDIGLLQEITGQKRNRAFSYAPYLDVFRIVVYDLSSQPNLPPQ
jgi:hypothetical protein